MDHLKNILEKFSFLSEKGFIAGEGSRRETNFGDTEIYLNGPQFRLRIRRDRGENFVDIGNDQGDWYKLEDALMFVDSDAAERDFGEPPKIDVILPIFSKNFDRLEQLFRTGELMDSFKRFYKERSQNLLDRLFPKT